MFDTIKTFAKGGIATATIGAMALAGATPAQAKDDDGISAGEIIAGAVVLGGIAAIASSAGRDRDDRYYRGDRYRGDRYGRDNRRGDSRYRYNSRAAIDQCVYAVREDARRYGGWRNVDIYRVQDSHSSRRGYRIMGLVSVEGRGRYDRRSRYGESDRGSFTCYMERGRVAHVDFKGIRGLR